MKLEILQKEMIAAMKSRNKERKDTISALISAVKKAAIDNKCKDNITDDLVDRVVLKEKKVVQEMIDTCPNERVELLNNYKNRLSIIDEFAPKLIVDEDEISKKIYHLLAITDIQEDNKGAVMKAIMPQLKGKVDMKVANKVLSNILSKQDIK